MDLYKKLPKNWDTNMKFGYMIKKVIKFVTIIAVNIMCICNYLAL